MRAIISCEADGGAPGDFWMVRQSELGQKRTSGKLQGAQLAINPVDVGKLIQQKIVEKNFALGCPNQLGVVIAWA